MHMNSEEIRIKRHNKYILDPLMAVECARKMGFRWEEVDTKVLFAIQQHPLAAVMYAGQILRGRWPEAECTIEKSEIAKRLYWKIFSPKKGSNKWQL